MAKIKLTPLQKAIAEIGGIPKLADALGISRHAIYQWQEVPADRVISVEKATGISRHDLRPDLHPRDSFAGRAA